MYSNIIKPALSFIGAFCAIVALLPILGITTVLLFVANKGTSPFFIQPRPGKSEKIFNAIKFKTMTDERDVNGNLLPDEQRLTRIGKFVRSTSIDELPQLFNILKGDMAFIGPRPLLVQYLPLYSEEQHRRHNVRPGLSGWAQVHGRNAISWSQKFEYDVWYVDHISFKVDWQIFWMTIYTVFARKDINSSTAATMEAFNGNN